MRKNKSKGILLQLFTISLITFGILNFIKNNNAHADVKDQINSLKNILDNATEADKKGFKISKVKQHIFVDFQVIARGVTISKIPLPLSGNTSEGVAYVSATIPQSIPQNDNVEIFLWRNGQETLIGKGGVAKNKLDSQLILVEGDNYICITIKEGRKYWGRSRVLKVNSPGGIPADCQSLPLNDFTSEAKDKGFLTPQKKLQCFPAFTLTGRGSLITDVPAPYSGNTELGVIDSNLILPKKMPKNSNVYIWVNGNETLIERFAKPKTRVLSKIVLAPGENYICAYAKKGGKLWGRTPIVKVKSSVRPSISRFELSWDGRGDIDLHLKATQKDIHVCYKKKTYDNSGYDINLDVDNTREFGPENIRIFELDEPTEFQCFINYYSGREKLNVVIRQFDKENKLIKTYTKIVNKKDRHPSAKFNNKSISIGIITINP